MSRSGFREHPARWILSILAAIVLAPILALIGVYVWAYQANNNAAQQFEERLLSLELPPRTELVDSTWGVTRFHGQGNGAQQGGGLLLRSDLSLMALEAFYEEQPGGHRVMPANDDDPGRESVLFNADHDLAQPGLFIVFESVEPTSWLLRDYDIRGR
ncbi:hypothetical protein ACFSWE_04335 [Leucobacter albus]|uniref:Uncharacterized protein n=1 Tax=Leucobacter albus TaxID=272210 RepID=A0ABW3TMT5_9MICO